MATKPFALEAEKPLGPIYFDTRTQTYWLQIPSGRFLNLPSSDTKLHLQNDGMMISETGKNDIKNGDMALIRAQIDRPIDYAGPLAGYPAGAYSTDGGAKILVTQEAQHFIPIPGESPALERFCTELLGTEQTQYFLLWLHFARESLEKRDFRARQLLALCGPSGCGKSLCQQIVTELLGGRVSKPYRYMVGETNFNADLCEAEHWCIEDEAASTDIRTRRAFGQAIKQACVNPLVSLHAKGRKAITVKVYKSMTASLNSESENMLILPPMDESIMDKIMLLKCEQVSIGKDGTITGNREKDWKKFKAELPAFAWQIDEMVCPAGMRDPRYGVKQFHHPELFERLCDMSQETRLLEFIEQFICADMGEMDPPWTGSATDLELKLKDTKAGFAVDRLLHFPNACGTYLSRLEKRMPDRFSSVKNRGKTVWRIKPKKKETENDQTN
jgi:hypothetical protein